MDSTKFRRIWPGVRNSVNAKGRFHSYQGRQAEIRRHETEARDAAEAATNARIDGLEQELARYHEAFSF